MPPDCIEWPGSRGTHGYGQVRIDGQMRLAHRVAWEREHGEPVPSGHMVCHSCDNPPCVNPAHLFIRLPRDNSADMAAKDRSTFGERNNTTWLTEDQVRQIRQLMASGTKQRDIAAKYGIGQQTVSAIATGRTWRRVA